MTSAMSDREDPTQACEVLRPSFEWFVHSPSPQSYECEPAVAAAEERNEKKTRPTGARGAIEISDGAGDARNEAGAFHDPVDCPWRIGVRIHDIQPTFRWVPR